MKLEQMDKIQEANIDTMKSMAGLAEKYTKWVEDQMEKSKEEMLVDNVGKINPVKHINQVRFFLSPDAPECRVSDVEKHRSVLGDDAQHQGVLIMCSVY